MTSHGAASCPAPEITLSPAEVPQGGELTVTVINLWVACYDTVQGAAPPASDVPVTLVVGAETFQLATIDAAANGTVSVAVRIPADAPTGVASLRVDLLSACYRHARTVAAAVQRSSAAHWRPSLPK